MPVFISERVKLGGDGRHGEENAKASAGREKGGGRAPINSVVSRLSSSLVSVTGEWDSNDACPLSLTDSGVKPRHLYRGPLVIPQGSTRHVVEEASDERRPLGWSLAPQWHHGRGDRGGLGRWGAAAGELRSWFSWGSFFFKGCNNKKKAMVVCLV